MTTLCTDWMHNETVNGQMKPQIYRLLVQLKISYRVKKQGVHGIAHVYHDTTKQKRLMLTSRKQAFCIRTAIFVNSVVSQ